MTDINEPLTEPAERQAPTPTRGLPRKSARRARGRAARLRRAAVLRLSRFHPRPRRDPQGFRLRPGASPGAALRQPPFGPARGRSARRPENHQAESGPRAEAAHRPGLYRAGGRQRRSPRAAASTRPRPAARLAERLAAPQLVRLAEALRAAGPGADAAIRRFLEAMINAEERPKVSSIMAASPATIDGDGKAEAS